MRVREPARRNSTFAGPVSWMSAHRRACKRRTHDDSLSVDLVVVGGEYLGGDRRGGQFVFECAALIYGRGFAHAPSPRRCSPPRGAVHVFSPQFQQTGSVTSHPPHEGQRVTSRPAASASCIRLLQALRQDLVQRVQHRTHDETREAVIELKMTPDRLVQTVTAGKGYPREHGLIVGVRVHAQPRFLVQYHIETAVARHLHTQRTAEPPQCEAHMVVNRGLYRLRHSSEHHVRWLVGHIDNQALITCHALSVLRYASLFFVSVLLLWFFLLASANRRFAWRRRARSSALRTERALEKCGSRMRSLRYSAKAFSPSSLKR